MFFDLSHRERIIQAGVELFTARGVENTTMAAIQAAAGTSVSTFYKYFGDKEALANEVYRGLHEVVEGVLSRAALDAGSPRAEFHRLWRQMVAFHQKYPHFLPFLARRDHDAYLDEVSRAIAQIPRPITDFLERLQRQKIAKNVSAVVLAAVVWGAFVELLEVSSSESPSPSEDQFNAAEECAWDAIRAIDSEPDRSA